jgi:hypothetical protein
MKFDTHVDLLLSEKMIRIPDDVLAPIKAYVQKIYPDVLSDVHINHYKPYSNINIRQKYSKKFKIVLPLQKDVKKSFNIELQMFYNVNNPNIAVYDVDENLIVVNCAKPLSSILKYGIEHEIIHNLQFTGYKFAKQVRGLPKKRLKSASRLNDTSVPHINRDVEFYPLLNTIYNEIKSSLNFGLKDKEKHSNRMIKFELLMNDRLKQLKQISPLKWSNMVKMLYRELSKQN